MVGAGIMKLQGGQRFVVTGGVKVQPVALVGGAQAELPPHPSRRTSVGAASGGGTSSDSRRPTSARKSSPEPFPGSSGTGGRYELQGSVTTGDREGGCLDEPDTRQRPASARPRLQQAPVCFAPPPAPPEHGQADALEWQEGREGGEGSHVPLRQALATPPPPPTGRSSTQAEREQDASSWKARLHGEGQHDTHTTPLARRASASAMQAQPLVHGAWGDTAGKGEVGGESDKAPQAGLSSRRRKVWQTPVYKPYSRKGEEFSTYASNGGGVELVTALALEPRSPDGPLDPLAADAGEGGEAQQHLRRYSEAVRDIEFGDVQRLMRGPLRIPLRARSAVGVSDGVFFENFAQTPPGARARRSAPIAPDQRPCALQGPRRVLGWGEGGRGGTRQAGLKATCGQRPASAGNLGSGGRAARLRGRVGPAPVASGRDGR